MATIEEILGYGMEQPGVGSATTSPTPSPSGSEVVNAPTSTPGGRSSIQDILAYGGDEATSAASASSPESGGVMRNVTAGVAKRLGEILDKPINLMSAAASLVTAPLTQGRVDPRPDAAQKGIAATGIPTTNDDPSGLAFEIGSEMVDSVLMGAGISGIAGGTTNLVTRPILKKITAALAANPKLNVLISAGSTPGAVIGGHMGEEAETGRGTGTVAGALTGAALGKKMAGTPGAVVGGLTGATAGWQVGEELPGVVDQMGATLAGGLATGLATQMAAGVVKGAGKATAQGVRNLMGDPGPTIHPVTSPLEDAMGQTKAYADVQIQGEVAHIDRKIQDVIEDFAQVPSPNGFVTGKELDNRLYTQLAKVREVAKNIVQRYWDRVDTKAGVNPLHVVGDDFTPGPMEQWVETAINSNYEQNLPMHHINKIREMFAFEEGQASKPAVTVGKLLDVRSTIMHERWDRQKGLGNSTMSPNEAKLSVELEEILENAIERSIPAIEIQQARGISRAVHDLFDRGPLAGVLNRTQRNEQAVPTGKFLETLMGRDDGMLRIREVTEKLSAIPRADRTTPLFQRAHEITAAEKKELFQLQKNFEETLTTKIRESAINEHDITDPAILKRFLGAHREEIAKLGEFGANFERSRVQLNALLDNKTMTQNSVVAKFTGMDPASGFQKIFADHTNASKHAAEIRKALPTREGQEAFELGLVQELMRRSHQSIDHTSVSPIKFYENFNRPEIRKMLSEQLPEDTFKRIDRIAESAHYYAGQPPRGEGFRIPAALGGAWAGRLIGKMVGVETLQGPSYMSRWGQDLVMRLVNEQGADKLLALAMTNANWERFLLGKLPTNGKEMRDMAVLARRLVSTETAAYHYLTKEKDREANEGPTLRTPQFADRTPGEAGYNTRNYRQFRSPDPTEGVSWQGVEAMAKSMQGLVPDSNFQRMLEGTPASENIEDRRGDLTSIGSYKDIIQHMDNEGYTQVPRFRSFVQRNSPFRKAGEDVPMPRPNPFR